MKIGLTGGIGSGKSTVAAIFIERGFSVIDLDLISRKVMEPNCAAYEKVIEAFGTDILDKDGKIMRGALREIIFNDAEKRKILENITHPAMLAAERAERARLLREKPKSHVITEAALMIETGGYKNYDIVIVVTAPEAERIKRAALRDSVTEADAVKVVAAQMPDSEKVQYAHMIIDNSGDFAALKNEAARVANLISIIIYGIKHP